MNQMQPTQLVKSESLTSPTPPPSSLKWSPIVPPLLALEKSELHEKLSVTLHGAPEEVPRQRRRSYLSVSVKTERHKLALSRILWNAPWWLSAMNVSCPASFTARPDFDEWASGTQSHVAVITQHALLGRPAGSHGSSQKNVRGFSSSENNLLTANEKQGQAWS
ncbi:unnamed protein product [Pleuronectes platessa]|uniref:Uncharacterized protein n=1 Tax=Pleuronectes platessa TaxID=8262 RepID=A0A9N7VPJ7_PLEPL|nr:unnamed protein product [Pleuronectes platessa]